MSARSRGDRRPASTVHSGVYSAGSVYLGEFRGPVTPDHLPITPSLHRERVLREASEGFRTPSTPQMFEELGGGLGGDVDSAASLTSSSLWSPESHHRRRASPSRSHTRTRSVSRKRSQSPAVAGRRRSPVGGRRSVVVGTATAVANGSHPVGSPRMLGSPRGSTGVSKSVLLSNTQLAMTPDDASVSSSGSEDPAHNRQQVAAGHRGDTPHTVTTDMSGFVLTGPSRGRTVSGEWHYTPGRTQSDASDEVRFVTAFGPRHAAACGADRWPRVHPVLF